MNTDAIAQAAAAKLDADRDERVSAVTALAVSAKDLDTARRELASAEHQHAQQYRATLRLGWTDTDLKGFGIEVPAKNLGGRPRKAKTTGTKTPQGPRPPAVDPNHVTTNFGGTNGPPQNSDS